MKQRIFGQTGCMVSEIGQGTWQLGTRWGDPFNREEAFKILEAAEAAGSSARARGKRRFKSSGIADIQEEGDAISSLKDP